VIDSDQQPDTMKGVAYFVYLQRIQIETVGQGAICVSKPGKQYYKLFSKLISR